MRRSRCDELFFQRPCVAGYTLAPPFGLVLDLGEIQLPVCELPFVLAWFCILRSERTLFIGEFDLVVCHFVCALNQCLAILAGEHELLLVAELENHFFTALTRPRIGSLFEFCCLGWACTASQNQHEKGDSDDRQPSMWEMD